MPIIVDALARGARAGAAGTGSAALTSAVLAAMRWPHAPQKRTPTCMGDPH
jgi:hypothetical protein